jgi:hypothetical protein
MKVFTKMITEIAGMGEVTADAGRIIPAKEDVEAIDDLDVRF